MQSYHYLTIHHKISSFPFVPTIWKFAIRLVVKLSRCKQREQDLPTNRPNPHHAWLKAKQGILLLSHIGPAVQISSHIYRSVPLIRPPILYTTSSLKWGEGLYSNMQLVLNISPPPPQEKKKFYAIATYTSKVHVYIRTQLQKHSTQNS